ncbi:MAG TPA: YbaK/EbsC family protein [Terriglobales bacterium]|nr:YbaK/EbsC family protein [Terriglobales bacterium]
MPVRKLKEFLDSQNIHYSSIPHSTAYTAQGIAAVTHISGKELAKTVIVKLDNELAMAVLPASQQVDMDMLKAATGAKSAATASEREFREKFPDCETGAMPPFGNLYNMKVFVEESLTKDREIAFNAGSHNELIRLAFVDYLRAVNPTVLKFGTVRTARAA